MPIKTKILFASTRNRYVFLSNKKWTKRKKK